MSDAYDYKSMYTITGAITSLGLGFYLTGDEKYADRAHQLLATWFIDPGHAHEPQFQLRPVGAGRRRRDARKA